MASSEIAVEGTNPHHGQICCQKAAETGYNIPFPRYYPHYLRKHQSAEACVCEWPYLCSLLKQLSLKDFVEKFKEICIELQTAIDTLEEKGMQNDNRYMQLLALRARYMSYYKPVEADSHLQIPGGMEQPMMTPGPIGDQPPTQSPLLGQPVPFIDLTTVQIPIPVKTGEAATVQSQTPSPTIPRILPQQGSSGLGQTGAPPSHPLQNQTRVTPISKRAFLDLILQERENRRAERIAHRIYELDNLPEGMTEDQKIKAEIELRGLRLLSFQKQLRREVIAFAREDTTGDLMPPNYLNGAQLSLFAPYYPKP